MLKNELHFNRDYNSDHQMSQRRVNVGTQFSFLNYTVPLWYDINRIEQCVLDTNAGKQLSSSHLIITGVEKMNKI